MKYDARILAKAWKEIESVRTTNENEESVRRSIAERNIPELLSIESEIRMHMLEIVRLSLSHVSNTSEKIINIKDRTQYLQERKADLLLKANFPADYLDPIYTCTECNDKGIVNGDKCGCLIRIYNRILTDELSPLLLNGNEKFDDFDITYYSDQYDSDLSASPRQVMNAVLKYCKEFADSFPDTHVNLLLQGGTGLGKTFLSACIAQKVSQKGYSICYSTVSSALDVFERTKFSRDASIVVQADAKVTQELECDLLIIDDLGTEITTSVSMSALYNLINTRLINKKPVIVSTNLSDTELASRYSKQIYSRLIGEFVKLPFCGDDIRILKKKS